MLPEGRVGVAQGPARPPFADPVKQLLGDGQVPQMVLDRAVVVFQQGVRVAEGVASLRLHRPVVELLRQVQRLLVVVGGFLELAEKDVGVSQVAVRPPLGGAVAELASDLEPLVVKLDGLGKVAEQVVDVAEVPAGPALRRLVGYLVHQGQVLLVVLRGLLEECLHLVGKLARVLVSQTPDVLTLGVVHVPEVVQGPPLPHAVAVLLADLQVPPAADDGLFELPHHLERVA